jgi:hypothetical protein
MSRFQPRGGIQTTSVNGIAQRLVGQTTPADVAFAAQQQLDFDACNKLIAGISFFLKNGNPDAAKIDQVQTLIQGIYVVNSVASLAAAGVSLSMQQTQAGLVDWTATLAARKAALLTY